MSIVTRGLSGRRVGALVAAGLAVRVLVVAGRTYVDLGGGFVRKPAKTWNGSAWVVDPRLKAYDPLTQTWVRMN